MAQKTAVEWFWIHLEDSISKQYYDLFEQAKAMEKEQIINTYLKGCARVTPYGNYNDSAEKYYKETYNK
jgi:hypothetical protein